MVDVLALFAEVFRQRFMLVPSPMKNLNEAYIAFDQPPGFASLVAAFAEGFVVSLAAS